MYQPVPHLTDPVPPSISHYRPILTQFHQVPTSTAPYWPSTTKHQPLLPNTDPAPPSTNQYYPILTQYHQLPASTALYWPSTIIYQFPSMSLETMSFATKSLATIVPRDKFYNRLKQKTRIIIQIRDLHCLLSLVSIIFTHYKTGFNWFNISHWDPTVITFSSFRLIPCISNIVDLIW